MQEEAVKELLRAWHITDVQDVSIPSSGTINTTVLINAGKGKFVLRKYHHTDEARIQSENDVIKYAFLHGIPAVCPLATTRGETVLVTEA